MSNETKTYISIYIIIQILMLKYFVDQLISDWNLVFFYCFTDKNIILQSPAHPVTEGDSVSLSCYLRREVIDSSVFFYHNDKLIQNDTRLELDISAVSKSDEGFYKCQHSRKESAPSWMSVQGE